MVRTFVIVAIAIIILSANFTIIHAQPLSQPPPPIQNPSTSATTTMTATTTTPSARTFLQSNNDSFSIRVPQGWTINDINNTGLVLSDEAVRGYGLLAQLCPAEDQQQLTFSTNASGSNTPSCRASENDVIHVIRYPNLETRLLANNGTAASNSNNTTTTRNITAYHLQKLGEVGYHDIKILRSANMRVNLSIAADANQTVAVATLPAKFAEMTYTTAIEPNETKTGYFILTATNATAPNSGTIKGYSVFYESNSNTSNSVTATPTITRTTATSSGNLASVPLSPAVQILGSFELIVAPELAQALAQQSAVGQTEQQSTIGQTQEGGGSCDPSYPDVCIPSPPPDLNCDDPGIPDNFDVVGSDPHGFDGDGDGIGCETSGGAGGSNDVGDDDDGGGDGDDGGGDGGGVDDDDGGGDGDDDGADDDDGGGDGGGVDDDDGGDDDGEEEGDGGGVDDDDGGGDGDDDGADDDGGGVDDGGGDGDGDAD